MLDKLKLWLLDRSPLAKPIAWFDGKKQAIGSLGAILVAAGTILVKYREQGNAYLLHVGGTPEFAALSVGWIGFFNAIKGEKTRSEIEKVDAKVEQLNAKVDGTGAEKPAA